MTTKMMTVKDVRSPMGQKLINDLMMELDDIEVGAMCEDGAETDEPLSTGRQQQRQQHPVGRPLRPTQPPIIHRSSGPGANTTRNITSAISQSTLAETAPGAAAGPDRPATAPPLSCTLIPPQLPSSRNPKDLRSGTPSLSPLLERHVTSRHANAYPGTITAVLHQVASPATTGASRDTQRRPGTVPRDVYHHSALSPPKINMTQSAVAEAAAMIEGRSTGASARVTSGSSGYGAGVPIAVVAAAAGAAAGAGGHRSRPSSPSTRGGEAFLPPPPPSPYTPHMQTASMDNVASHLVSMFGGSGVPTRLGGDGYVPYLDRSYGSLAPLACAVDAVARRAEAHKALTRQRLMAKQIEEQGTPTLGGRKAQILRGNQSPDYQHLVLVHNSPHEPYQLRMEGGVLPVALGLSWDTSPGVVAAAAAAAASAAASAALKVEDRSSRPVSPVPHSPASPTPKGPPIVTYIQVPTSPTGGRRRRGIAAWAATASGRVAPAGGPSAPSSPARKHRMPRTPRSAAEAAAMAEEANASVQAHLPPAVRRGYSGQIVGQTVQDWETISEPNRRMMQQIEVATTLVRGSPGRAASRTSASPSPATTVPGGGSSLPSPSHRGTGSVAVSAPGSVATPQSGRTANYGLNTSARSRRRYIRYSVDIFPELGLPERLTRDPGASRGESGGVMGHISRTAYMSPLGSALSTISGRASPSPPFTQGLASPVAQPEDEGGALEGEPSMGALAGPGAVYYGDLDMRGDPGSGGRLHEGHEAAISGSEWGSDSITSHAPPPPRGPRYLPAAAARVPVPVSLHLNPLPTPPAAVAAVIAGGGAVGAAAAALPQWIDPRACARAVSWGAEDPTLGGTSTFISPPRCTSPTLAVSLNSSKMLTPTGSLALTSSLRGEGSVGGLGARGVGLQGFQTGTRPGSREGQASLTMTSSASQNYELVGYWSAGYGETLPTTQEEAAQDQQQQPQQPVGGVGRRASTPALASDIPVVTRTLSTRHKRAGSVVAVTFDMTISVEDGLAAAAAGGSADARAGNPRRSSSDAAVDGGPAATSAGADRTGRRRSSELSLPSATPRRGSGAEASPSQFDMISHVALTVTRSGAPAPSIEVSLMMPDGSNRDSATGLHDMQEMRRVSKHSQDLAMDPSPALDLGRAAATSAAWNSRRVRQPDGDAGDGGDGGSRLSTPASGLAPGSSKDTSPSRARTPPTGPLASGGAEFYEFNAATAADGDAGAGMRALHSRASSREQPDLHMRRERTASRDSSTSSRAAAAAAAHGTGATDAAAAGHDGAMAAGRATSARDPYGDAVTREDGPDGGTAGAGAAAVRRVATMPATPQGPVQTPGMGYRIVTSVAAAVASEDPREAARLAQQRDLEEQLARNAGYEVSVKAASRATRALARAGTQTGSQPAAPTVGYSIVQPRVVMRTGTGSGAPLDEPPAASGALSVVAAQVPAPAEMAAMSQAARAVLEPQQRLNRHVPHLAEGSRSPSPPGRGHYQHVQAPIRPGRTAQMQDVWAS